ncbi:unnamed protein product [Brassica rapa]|uniref:Uncharacterized protein n=1 Tax=Brassica campestris TaxID=3711 RepID=A0A8D9GX84_BRACM|nr:unnamed protein product [Brassica rapa]
MRPPPDCRPSVGASAPKGTCRWLSPFGGSAVRTALNYNYHRVAGRILCKWQIYKKIPSEVRDFYLVKFTLNLIFQIGR